MNVKVSGDAVQVDLAPHSPVAMIVTLTIWEQGEEDLNVSLVVHSQGF